jgi:hypothetical protein
MSQSKLILIVGGLLTSWSIFSLVSAMLILATYFLQRDYKRATIGLLIGGAAIALTLSLNEYFLSRFTAIDITEGEEGLGTGLPRLLPYLYIFERLVAEPWNLLFGVGAGVLETEFFVNVGQFHTEHDTFSTYMAGAIYNYGLPVFLAFLFLLNKPRGFLNWSLFIVTAMFIFLNTGIGTYLFIAFGVFALLEQRFRSL